MLYTEIETVQGIRWIDGWFWKRSKAEKEFPNSRLARMFEVSEQFVEDVIKRRIYPDVKAANIWPCMEQAVHRNQCLKHLAELPEHLLSEPSPAVLELMEIEESLK